MQTRIARIVPVTEAEGPGRRVAIWFQGCPLRCPGCCNPEYLSFDGGDDMTIDEIKEAFDASQVEGVSFLGGEPFAHRDALLALATAAWERTLSVMIYSGYTMSELTAMNDSLVGEILAKTDLLVDGRYDRTQPEPTRRWIGSANQQMHFLSDRYSPADPCFTMPNTLEIRVRGTEITVNGFPAADARGLWKGWRRRG
jgi:anaerobic ribonucleoside-triphosphate reductase activating protein